MMTAPTVTVAALAKMFSLTASRIYTLAKDGIIPRPERGKIELIAAVEGYVKYLQQRAEGKGVEAQGVHAANARLVRAQAKKAEIEVKKLEGTLLDAGGGSCARMATTGHGVSQPGLGRAVAGRGAAGGNNE